jgi:Mg/Co/Ni transporter MgtE
MIDDMLYQEFLKLTDNKKIDYLYTALVEKDLDKLKDKYGPKEIAISINENYVLIESYELKDVRVIRDNMILSGMILVDEVIEEQVSQNNKPPKLIVSYLYEGEVQPICLN